MIRPTTSSTRTDTLFPSPSLFRSTIILQGTADTLTPPETAKAFCLRAKALKFQCDVVSYPGAPHGFTEAWLGLEDPSLGLKAEVWQWDTIRRTDAFLSKLGWLPRSSPPR